MAAETAIGLEREPGLHEIDRFLELDGVLAASLVELTLEPFPQRLGRCAEPVFQLVGVEIVEAIDRSRNALPYASVNGMLSVAAIARA